MKYYHEPKRRGAIHVCIYIQLVIFLGYLYNNYPVQCMRKGICKGIYCRVGGAGFETRCEHFHAH